MRLESVLVLVAMHIQVVVFDYINRSADHKTFCAIQKCLDDSGIAHAVGSYHGQKITGVIVSDDLKFIRSM